MSTRDDSVLELLEETRRRLAELEGESRRYRATLLSIGDAVITTDRDGRVVQMNPTAESLTGWSEREAVGHPLASVFRVLHEGTREPIESPVEHVLREERVVGLANHALLVARDGSERPIADSGAPIRDEKGRVTGVVLVFRDQSEERRTQRVLEASERRLRTALDDLLEGCQILGHDWRYVYLNRMAEVHNRRPSTELLGQRYMDMWPGIERTEVFQRIRQTLETRAPGRMTNEFEFPDGRRGWFDLRFEPVPEGVLILSVDITDQKRGELRILHLNRVLSAIRNVNQLIVRVKDPVALAERVCGALVESGSYGAVWLTLDERHDSPLVVSQAGQSESFASVRENLANGWRPPCWGESRERDERVSLLESARTCPSCPLWAAEQRGPAGVVPLRYGEFEFGRLVLCRAPGLDEDADERDLLAEVADDLGHALYAIRSERQRTIYGQMVAASEEAMALVGRDYVFLDVNAKYAHYWNRQPAQVVGRRAMEVVGDEFFYRVAKQNLDAALRGLTIVSEVNREIPGVGRVLGEVRYTPSIGPDGTIDAVAVTIRDITQRRDAEVRLKDSEARLSAIFHHSPVGIVFTRLEDGLILDVNAAFAGLYGYLVEELVGHTSNELGLWADPAEREEMTRRLTVEGTCRDLEIGARHKSGEVRFLRVTVELVELGGARYAIGIAQDVTDRRRMEATLGDRDRLLRMVGQVAKIGGFEFDPATGSGSWTEEVALIHDLPPDALINVETGIDYYYGESREKIAHAVREAVERAQPYDLELEITTARGAHKWVRTIAHPVVENGRVVKVWGAFQDITERKHAEAERARLEELLRASQKMEAIGTLAGGVAHDFNNLLVVILNDAEAVLDGLPPGDPLREDVRELRDAGQRAAALTRQLLAFSRRQVLQPVPLAPKRAVENLEGMLRRILGEDVEFRLELAPDTGVILADAGQIEQVLMNLVVNARDAMPEGGTLTIATRNVENHGMPGECEAGCIAGPCVQLRVTDTGCGIASEDLPRIFEPFFTTKEKGRGTGLGLATTYGIVHQSGGAISVESELGVGTTLRVCFPRAFVEVPPAEDSPAHDRPRGEETVLVVEDEDALRRLVTRILESSGYHVLGAANLEQALEAATSHGGRIDLLLTDVVMPRAGGRKVAQELERLHPALRVLYMSGYSDDAIANHGTLEPGTHFLAKPFTSSVLLRKVREVLDASERAPSERASEPLPGS